MTQHLHFQKLHLYWNGVTKKNKKQWNERLTFACLHTTHFAIGKNNLPVSSYFWYTSVPITNVTLRHTSVCQIAKKSNFSILIVAVNKENWNNYVGQAALLHDVAFTKCHMSCKKSKTFWISRIFINCCTYQYLPIDLPISNFVKLS